MSAAASEQASLGRCAADGRGVSAHVYANARLQRWASELAEFVRIPSVGADPARGEDMVRAAAWLAGRLRSAGVANARVVGSQGAPLVWASRPAPPGRPTLLLYGHYDVQPADPGDGWTVPPFGGLRRDDSVLGRGATDDKGQVLAQVAALESVLATHGRLPVGLLVLYEGEEESGSPQLLAALEREGRTVGADAALISDSRMRAADHPALVVRLRGQLGAELDVRAQPRELHAGVYGGAVPDATAALCQLVAALHDRRGRITVPGFYDRVRAPDPSERARLLRDGPADAEVSAEAGCPVFDGAYERTILRPALTVAGVSAGYPGAGSKAIVPTAATAKLDIRLVCDQEPAEIAALLRGHLAARAPAGVHVDLRILSQARPVALGTDHVVARVAEAALGRAFGVRAARMGSGGTIPIVDALQRRCRIPVVLMGFADPTASIHGPDERMSLSTFSAAVHALIDTLEGLRAW